MKEIFENKLPVKLKTKALEVRLLPCLRYGCQSWPITNKVINKVKICQRAIESSILGLRLRDRILDSNIRTKARDVVKHILKLKWKWTYSKNKR